ncbi:MAG: hypothetical protein HY540_05155, partial [Deltaproteobacteria bacterium]|nr:hypothetical protein [Deltaproteobacteria bacterium]
MKTFPQCYPVTSGETLKAVEHFPKHIRSILMFTSEISRRDLTIICVGGGSVTDFGGFVASVLKRGVNLVHIPSTWLAAIDAAHGGKTALNVAGIKNQIGTFYPASKIFLVKEVLMAQPEPRANEALPELVKIAMIDGGVWAQKLLEDEQTASSALIWKNLRHAIAAKQRIVAQDPYEKNGKREVLNLGHTVGHVYEAYYGMPHGEAIAHGLRFALKWSLKKFQGETLNPLLCKEGNRG